MGTDKRLLTEKELSTWLGLSLPTLQRMRSKGGGPKFVRLSLRRVGYRPSEVEAGWIHVRLAVLASGQQCARSHDRARTPTSERRP